MPANPPGFERERQELSRILRASVFARSPNLTAMLAYVCEKYFAGDLDALREYQIATDAFGRPSSFDPKQDSIVRVEAHRLRRKLQDYYAHEGAPNPVRISVAAGSYLPTFEFIEPAATETAAATPAPPGNSTTKWVWLAAVLILCVTGVLYFRSTRVDASRPKGLPPAVTVPEATQPPASGRAVRILAGSTVEQFTDSAGHSWSGDRFFKGGAVRRPTVRRIFRTRDPELFSTLRTGDFTYDIPLSPGIYELRLYFAESFYGEENQTGGAESARIFCVTANGENLLYAWDALADAGGDNTATVKVFKNISPAADGKLHLVFGPAFRDYAFVNAIEIVPSTPGRMIPVRITTSTSVITDHAGRQWLPDRFFRGGQTVKRYLDVEGTQDPQIFTNERFGNFSYHIPVALNGAYKVTLHFCETRFGTAAAKDNPVGQRVFDVHCNGKALLQDFDIAKEAGPRRALVKTFRGVKPNGVGKISLDFVPGPKNYPLINAIEVEEEQR